MTIMSDALGHRRLRAPRISGGVLIDPPLSAADEMIASTDRLRRESNYDFQGKSLQELSALARQELIDAAAAYTREYRDVNLQPSPASRVILAGHQPEVFHPGVWFKNFALSAIGRAQNATAVNLVIDSDTIKAASIRVPTGTATDPRNTVVQYDHSSAEIPHEERRILDRDVFRSFGTRVKSSVRTLIPDPLIEQYWPAVLERSQHTANLGECIAQARHQLEGAWGQSTLELTQSHVCRLQAFHWFAAHLLANLPRLWEIYNSALNEYRKANHIRSHAHPVPELAMDGDWLEAPFWIWTSDNPQRRRLFVRENQDGLELTDRNQLFERLDLTADAEAFNAVEQLAQLASRGIKLRTRALGTTILARLLMGDVFLHGIGGAKYDELTDVLIARYFGIQPPEYFAISATLHLPIQRDAPSNEDAQRVNQQLRELEFHPEKFISAGHYNGDAGILENLIGEKQRLISAQALETSERERCHAIRQLNAEMQPWLELQRQHLLSERESLAHRLRAEAVLSSREYSFCLYPQEALRKLMLSL